jgi:hypothetical protein
MNQFQQIVRAKAPFTRAIAAAILIMAAAGCGTTENQVQRWERSGNVKNLSQVARRKSESPYIRRKSLESLARLNWKPSNAERLQVYSLFASKSGCAEAAKLMQTMTADQFTAIDSEVVACGSLLDADSGSWTDTARARPLYDKLESSNGKAVTISLCQQIVAHPELQTRLLLLAIKLGIAGSEDDLIALLFEYGDKTMAEDYLNCGSSALEDGGRRWANANGYNVMTGYGSHRSGWGSFQ